MPELYIDCKRCNHRHHINYIHPDKEYDFRCMRCGHQWRTKRKGYYPKSCGKCVRPDMMVSGCWYEIQNVRENCIVLSKDGLIGRESLVKKTFRHKSDYQELIEIKASGCLPVFVTPNHKLWSVECKQLSGGKHRKFSRTYLDPEYVEAKDLMLRPLAENLNSNGHYLVMPKPAPQYYDVVHNFQFLTNTRGYKVAKSKGYPTGLRITPENAWLLGLFVAEGHATEDGHIIFSLGSHETDLIARCFKRIMLLGYSPYLRTVGSVTFVGFGSHLLARWLRIVIGTYCYNKKIPDSVLFHSSLEVRKSFLQGYIAGDGHIDIDRKMLHASTVSKILALQLQLLSITLDSFFGISVNDHSHYEKKLVNGRVIRGGLIYQLQSSSSKLLSLFGICKKDRHNKSYVVMDNCVLVPVSYKRICEYDGDVCNIETTTGSYLIHNLAVKNCHSSYWDRPRLDKSAKSKAKVNKRKREQVKAQKRKNKEQLKKVLDVESKFGAGVPPSVRMKRQEWNI